MTNEELFNKCKTIEELKNDYNKFIDDYGLLCNDFVDICEENSKLKAENEQLKSELAQLKPSEPKHKPQRFHRFKDGEHKDVDVTMRAYNKK